MICHDFSLFLDISKAAEGITRQAKAKSLFPDAHPLFLDRSNNRDGPKT